MIRPSSLSGLPDASLSEVPDPWVLLLIRVARLSSLSKVPGRPSGSLAYPDNLAILLIRATQFSDYLDLPGLPDSRVILLIRATRFSDYLALPGLPDSQLILIIQATQPPSWRCFLVAIECCRVSPVIFHHEQTGAVRAADTTSSGVAPLLRLAMVPSFIIESVIYKVMQKGQKGFLDMPIVERDKEERMPALEID
jgi:hypothetical protein